jgi:hypothetical protein
VARQGTPPTPADRLGTPVSRLGTAGSEGRAPSRGHHFTLTVRDGEQGEQPAMFFMDSGGGREMTLIAKKPLPSSWAAQEPRVHPRRHVAKSEQPRSIQLDQTRLMGIAHKVHTRLLSELQEAQALLVQERQRSAEIATKLSPERLQQLNAAFPSPHFDSQRTPMRSDRPQTQTADAAIQDHSEANSPGLALRGQRSPLISTVESTKPRGIKPDPNRYRAPPRSDTRTAFARGRGLDFLSGVTRSATWRLQHQWQGGLNWKEFQGDDRLQSSGDPEVILSGSHTVDCIAGIDIDGRIEAERVLRKRLTELGEAEEEGRNVSQDHPRAPQSRAGTSASRATHVTGMSEAHVAGVRRARLQAFQECFDSLICRFDKYSPLLSRIKREFDSLVDAFEQSIDDVTARKVEPVAKQADDLKMMKSSCEKRIETLTLELRELEAKAHTSMERVRHLTESNSACTVMVGTRQIQSRKSDQDFTKRSLYNDTLTMKNFDLKGIRAQQSSIRQQISKNEAAIVELEIEIKRMHEEEDQLKKELDLLCKEAQEHGAGLRPLVHQHCTDTGESWDVNDLERALIATGDSRLTNHDIARILTKATL